MAQRIFNIIQSIIGRSTKEYDDHVRILHLSKNFLVVHKPYDMLINCNESTKRPTLQAELTVLLPHLVNPKLFHGFHFAHRLDYVTSGVICMPVNKTAARVTTAAFTKRVAKKFYLALLHGHVQQLCIVIDKPIGTDSSNKENHKMCTTDSTSCENPKDAFTKLFVLEHGYLDGTPATKVLLHPETGRQHQIRVHCNSIGHNIIGDYVYSQGKDLGFYRTFLHSYRLIMNNE